MIHNVDNKQEALVIKSIKSLENEWGKFVQVERLRDKTSLKIRDLNRVLKVLQNKGQIEMKGKGLMAVIFTKQASTIKREKELIFEKIKERDSILESIRDKENYLLSLRGKADELNQDMRAVQEQIDYLKIGKAKFDAEMEALLTELK